MRLARGDKRATFCASVQTASVGGDMGMLGRGLALVLCALLVFTLLPTPVTATEPAGDPSVPTFPAPQVSDNPEVFRIQLLEFLQGVSDALVVALDHPVIGPQLRERMQGGSVSIPL